MEQVDYFEDEDPAELQTLPEEDDVNPEKSVLEDSHGVGGACYRSLFGWLACQIEDQQYAERTWVPGTIGNMRGIKRSGSFLVA